MGDRVRRVRRTARRAKAALRIHELRKRMDLKVSRQAVRRAIGKGRA